MNKTPKINRLFLGTVFWYFCRLYTICPFNGRNTVDAFKSDFIFDSGNRFYGC